MGLFDLFRKAKKSNEGNTADRHKADDTSIMELNSKNNNQKRNAIALARESRNYFAVDKLIEILDNQKEDDINRCLAASALGKIGDSKALNVLLKTLKDPNWEIRDSSAHALGNLGDSRAIDSLKQAQHDCDIHVIDAANNALLKLNKINSINEFIENFNDKDATENELSMIAINLSEIIETLGHPEALLVSQWCINTLKSNDPVRFSTISGGIINKILSNIALHGERDNFVKLLVNALNHKEYKIRGSASEALGIILSEDPSIGDRDQIIDKLIAKLDDSIFDVRRRTIISLCWYIKDKRAIKPIQKVADKDIDSREWILRQIEELLK